ncbi:PL29 family lyase N-terminal domain-containing protein [Niabella aurantiaca]|uniref:PL29 family lyase N-terminal domain-containing protein n=1 Tax=Niabella aurantiaca TaxID=379900 RepID=UPI0003657350|nr:PL29 family lyase N-terminal domain-containing protein [Niabella aurantiaca]
MKLKLLFSLFILTSLFACQKKDLDALRRDLDEQKDRIAQLEALSGTLNADVKALQLLTAALQKNISVKNYTATSTGYLLTMSDGCSIELKNGVNGTNGTNGRDGKDGRDGANAPQIGAKQDTDGRYYWTLGGNWLLQNGQKLPTMGMDGTNGTDGTDGVTPLLQVDTGTNQWMISYDQGINWNTVKDSNGTPVPATGPQGPEGQPGATGPQGPEGVSGFTIIETDEAIAITYMGVSYTFPKSAASPGLYKIVLVTTKSLSESLNILVDAAPADRSGVWIDLNNDEKQDPGEKINEFGGDFIEHYPLNVTQTITIYGKITRLVCDANKLSHLDVSQNNALTKLSCIGNQLTSLDVSKNIALDYLYCYANHLGSLDVSKNTALILLDCSTNPLGNLDVSKNTALTLLGCSYNQLSNLNVSQNTALTHLSCAGNQLTGLDVSKNIALTTLYCYTNKLSSLDVSQNTALATLDCSGNQIKNTQMTALITSLPVSTTGATAYIFEDLVINGNTMPAASEIGAANAKNWTLYKRDNFGAAIELTP